MQPASQHNPNMVAVGETFNVWLLMPMLEDEAVQENRCLGGSSPSPLFIQPFRSQDFRFGLTIRLSYYLPDQSPLTLPSARIERCVLSELSRWFCSCQLALCSSGERGTCTFASSRFFLVCACMPCKARCHVDLLGPSNLHSRSMMEVWPHSVKHTPAIVCALHKTG